MNTLNLIKEALKKAAGKEDNGEAENDSLERRNKAQRGRETMRSRMNHSGRETVAVSHQPCAKLGGVKLMSSSSSHYYHDGSDC